MQLKWCNLKHDLHVAELCAILTFQFELQRLSAFQLRLPGRIFNETFIFPGMDFRVEMLKTYCAHLYKMNISYSYEPLYEWKEHCNVDIKPPPPPPNPNNDDISNYIDNWYDFHNVSVEKVTCASFQTWLYVLYIHLYS